MTDIEYLKRVIVPILRRHGVERAAVFGSFARGDAGKDSDIDILVELDDGLGLLDFIGLKQELEDAVGRNVDLVEYDLIKPSLKQRILDEQVGII